MNIKIGTRGSKLAIIQAEYVKNRLKERYPDNDYEIVIIKTKGDIIQDKPLGSIGSSGVFVKEIEEKLQNGEIDMAVHSMKDMPAYTAEGLALSKCWAREDNRDVLIVNRKKHPDVHSIWELNEGAVIGTGSVRRRALLKALRDDLSIVNIRGNVDTRLRKMEEQSMDAIVLAAAGLRRMGMENYITYYFDTDEITPSPAQGILALEYKEDNYFIKEILDSLYDEKAEVEGKCERAFLREMGADCHTPIGAACKFDRESGSLSLEAFFGRSDGSRIATVSLSGSCPEELVKAVSVKIRRELAGKVWLVGAGPGNTGLMTVKGKEIIEKADCIIYDRLANEEILGWCREECEKIYVGKENHYHTMKQEDINRLLIKKSLEHDNVVRLKGGDPYVFGRGGEEGIALTDAGVCFEAIPGVTSAIAGLCHAGIPITHRGLATGMRIVTAHNKNDRLADLDFESMAKGNETLVFMMGLSKLDEICEKLMAAGMDRKMPVAVISNATTKKQKTVVSELEGIVEKVKETDEIVSPALIAVGRVIELREKINVPAGISEKEKMQNRKYLVPKIGKEKSKLSAILEKMGEKPVEIQVGQIETIPVNLEEKLLKENQIIIFTSGNGVRSFFENLYKSNLDARSLYNCTIAAVGIKTAEVLKSFGIKADIIPEKYGSEQLAEIIGVSDSKCEENIQSHIYSEGCGDFCKKILYVKGKNVQNNITEHSNKQVKLTCLDVYENKKIIINEWERQKIIKETKEAAGIFFTCASNVERFFEILYTDEKPDLTGKKIISIGDKCSSALKEAGITDYTQAQSATFESMAKSLKMERKKS